MEHYSKTNELGAATVACEVGLSNKGDIIVLPINEGLSSYFKKILDLKVGEKKRIFIKFFP